jgi:hypothetical protein
MLLRFGALLYVTPATSGRGAQWFVEPSHRVGAFYLGLGHVVNACGMLAPWGWWFAIRHGSEQSPFHRTENGKCCPQLMQSTQERNQDPGTDGKGAKQRSFKQLPLKRAATYLCNHDISKIFKCFRILEFAEYSGYFDKAKAWLWRPGLCRNELWWARLSDKMSPTCPDAETQSL